jgi:deazaflavin-dependent oxidoreductase (nitroreductase family)
MTDRAEPIPSPAIPSIVHRLNPLVLRLLKLGVPMGPNVLITIRGRKSGEPRTFPVALLHAEGRRFLFSPFGEVQWVQNLRASGEAAIGRGGHLEPVTATALDVASAARFLEAGLRPAFRVPVMGPMIAGWYGITRDSTPADYLAGAGRHPAFELRPIERAGRA